MGVDYYYCKKCKESNNSNNFTQCDFCGEDELDGNERCCIWCVEDQNILVDDDNDENIYICTKCSMETQKDEIKNGYDYIKKDRLKKMKLSEFRKLRKEHLMMYFDPKIIKAQKNKDQKDILLLDERLKEVIKLGPEGIQSDEYDSSQLQCYHNKLYNISKNLHKLYNK